jgi:hypothetical protein
MTAGRSAALLFVLHNGRSFGAELQSLDLIKNKICFNITQQSVASSMTPKAAVKPVK